MERRTYTSLARDLKGAVRDVRALYRIRARDLAEQVRQTLEDLATAKDRYARAGAGPLRDRDVLVIGVGQTPRELMALSVGNRVTGIDLDVIPWGFDPAAYIRLARQNGLARAVKTLGRKVLLIDWRYAREIRRFLPDARLDSACVLQMDAAAMTFPDVSFDLVYSFSVFEHLPDPEAALRGAVRVVRPGGVILVSAHLYTAEGGCHDLRIFSGDRADIPYWAHLRPRHRNKVVESAWMNKWRLGRWEDLFRRVLPGAEIDLETHHATLHQELEKELEKLRAEGELAEYEDRELLSVNVGALWRKAVG